MHQPKETDLYPHIHAWLENQGFTVHAEVKGCDIAAHMDGELVLIEIKRSVNMELLFQLVRRQAATSLVYAAVPAPRSFESKRWLESIRLLKRLGAGLIIVFLSPPRVEVLLHPVRQIEPRRNQGKSFLAEMASRSMNVNTGGAPGWNAMDSYLEKAIWLAVVIDRCGPSSKNVLSLLGPSSLTGQILRRNRGGWFAAVGPGVYDLTDKGRKALLEYQTLADHYRDTINRIMAKSG